MILRGSSRLLQSRECGYRCSTESHRDSLLLRLPAHGLDIGAAIEQGGYIALDAADALPKLILRDVPDSVRFLHVLGNLISTAAKTVKGKQARVAIFGEMCHLLSDEVTQRRRFSRKTR